MKWMKYFSSLICLFITLLLVSPKSYAHFDELTTSANKSNNIGSWVYTQQLAGNTDKDDLSYLFGIIFRVPEDDWVKKLVKNIVFKTDPANQIISVRNKYEENTIAQLQDILKWWKDFFNFNNEVSAYDVSTNTTSGTKQIPSLSFTPGQFVLIPQVIITSGISNNTTIVMNISMQSDIDFVVEPIFDFSHFQSNPFTLKQTVGYISETNSNRPTIISSDIINYTTQANHNKNRVLYTHNHSIQKPQLTGTWGRLTGINYYVTKNLNSFDKDWNTTTREGTMLLGLKNSTSNLSLEVSQLNPINANSLDTIPFFLLVSRGSGSYNINASAVQPSIQVSVSKFS